MQPLLTHATLMACPHGGRLSFAATGPRVFASGAAILTADAVASITGCPVPLPATCVTAQWSAGSARVLVGGRPVLLSGSAGSCRSASSISQGPVGIGTGSARVFGI